MRHGQPCSALRKDPLTPDGEPLGVGTKIAASYWRDWLRRDPVATMATLHVPALVLRGENDNNTSQADFEALRKAATAPGQRESRVSRPEPRVSSGARGMAQKLCSLPK